MHLNQLKGGSQKHDKSACDSVHLLSVKKEKLTVADTTLFGPWVNSW